MRLCPTRQFAVRPIGTGSQQNKRQASEWKHNHGIITKFRPISKTLLGVDNRLPLPIC